jgi:hypothetical protein
VAQAMRVRRRPALLERLDVVRELRSVRALHRSRDMLRHGIAAVVVAGSIAVGAACAGTPSPPTPSGPDAPAARSVPRMMTDVDGACPMCTDGGYSMMGGAGPAMHGAMMGADGGYPMMSGAMGPAMHARMWDAGRPAR